MKDEKPDWSLISVQLKIGMKVCGRIHTKRRFGIFVQIESPVKFNDLFGLIEIIRISDSPEFGNHQLAQLEIGEEICAVVIWLEEESGIKLSTRKSDFEKYGFEGGY